MEAGLTVLARDPGWCAHTIAGDRIWASRGYSIGVRAIAARGARFEVVARVPADWTQRAAARLDLVANGLRLGVHDVLPLASGALLVSVSGRLLRLANGSWASSLVYDGFRKPARRGILCDRAGFVHVAEYRVNRDLSRPVRVWRSDDDAVSFRVTKVFPAGTVRHVHFLQEDPLDGSLWLGTGDRDAQVWLLRSDDHGVSWETVGGGHQRWRALGLAFREDAIWFGTDAGNQETWENQLVRLDRASGRLDEVRPLQGPSHGVATLADDSILIATAVESGPNEADRSAHLWHGRDGGVWREIASWPRGWQPPIAQYGLVTFPRGLERCVDPVLVQRGLRGAQLATLEARLAP